MAIIKGIKDARHVCEEPEAAMDIGIRDLRDSLSRHLRAVSAGASVTITDHGRAIARIVPMEGSSAFEVLLAGGLLRPPDTAGGDLPEPIAIAGTVSDLVDEQRR